MTTQKTFKIDMIEDTNGCFFAADSERHQIVAFNCRDVFHKLPDSDERQYKSRTEKRRFDAATRASGCHDGMLSDHVPLWGGLKWTT